MLIDKTVLPASNGDNVSAIQFSKNKFQRSCFKDHVILKRAVNIKHKISMSRNIYAYI